ncbi:MAG: hypothetical protein V7731_22870 [Amphritea sp.]
MEIGRFKLALLIGAPIMVILIGVAGYFIYSSLDEQHKKNRANLEGFGGQIIPLSEGIDPNSELSLELAPSIGSQNLTPTQRVITTLKAERVKLLEEAIIMRQKITDLKTQVAELENYKRTNERYSPHTFNEEVSTVHTRIKQLLATRDETQRFNRRQTIGMSAASAQEYRRYLTLHKLTLEQAEIDDVVNDHLPVFAFCIGDGIEVAANNATEEALLVTYFKTGETELMGKRLQSDLKAILEPCQEIFAKRLGFLARQS